MNDPSQRGDQPGCPDSFATWIRRELRRQRALIAVATLAALAAASLATIASWLMVPIGALLFPGTAASGAPDGPGAFLSALFGQLVGAVTPLRLVLVLIGTYGAKNVAEYVARLSTDQLALRTERRLRQSVWRAIWAGPERTSRPEGRGPLAHALLADAYEAASGLALSPTRLVGDPLTAFGFLVTMFWISPVLALVLLGIVPAGVWVTRRGLKSIAARADERSRARVHLGARLGELLRFSPVVRAHGAHAWAAAQGDVPECAAYRAATAWTRRMRAIPSGVEIMAASAGALVIWMGMQQIGARTIAGPEFLAFLTALFLLLPVVKRLAALGGELRTARAAWERLLSHADRKNERSMAGDLTRARRSAPTIRLRGVSVRGWGNTTPLRSVSLDIPAGAFVAVVGPTGAGKSLLLEVIAGLLPPGEGYVAWDDEVASAPDVQPEPLPVGYVPQEGWMVGGTVSENLALGRGFPREAMEAALRDVSLVLPRGIDTRVGEDGAPLSGGERQRLALARAMLGEPQLLVLDEPTSAVDASVERAVVARLVSRKGRATIIVATHRSALIECADIVVSMRRGTVASVRTTGERTAAPAAHRREVAL